MARGLSCVFYVFGLFPIQRIRGRAQRKQSWVQEEGRNVSTSFAFFESLVAHRERYHSRSECRGQNTILAIQSNLDPAHVFSVCKPE